MTSRLETALSVFLRLIVVIVAIVIGLIPVWISLAGAFGYIQFESAVLILLVVILYLSQF